MLRYQTAAETATALVDGGAVVLDLVSKRYYSLNETGTIVWQYLEHARHGGNAPGNSIDGNGDGEREGEREGVSDAELALTDALVARFRIERADARRAVAAFIGELRSEGLLTVESE